ncbi:MAG: AI-2E family transporter [Eubacteriales bacterium]|nr:AI-2E family transporter [Eubacteriales bacterium]
MNKDSNNSLKIILRNVITVAICIVIYFVISKFSVISAAAALIAKIIRPFIFGAVIAYLLIPVSDYFHELLKNAFKTKEMEPEKSAVYNKRLYTFSMFLSLALLIIAVTGFFAAIIPQIVGSIRTLVSNMPDIISGAEAWIENFVSNNPVFSAQINQWFDNLQATTASLESELPFLSNANITHYVGAAATSVKSAIGIIKDIAIGAIIAMYIMSSRRTFLRQAKMLVLAAFPYKWDLDVTKEQTADFIFREAGIFNKYMSGFIKGKIIDSAIICCICLAFTFIVKMPYWALVSVIVGITNIIPFFGPFIGAIPSSLLILTESPGLCLLFIIFIIILQQLDGNVIGPKILGSATNLSSFWVLFAILFFGGIMGIPGMIIGVPVFGFIYQLVRELVYKRINKQKALLKDVLSENEDILN